MGSVKKKYKPLTSQQRIDFWQAVENESMSYGISNGYIRGKDFPGTRLGELLDKARPILKELDSIYSESEGALDEE